MHSTNLILIHVVFLLVFLPVANFIYVGEVTSFSMYDDKHKIFNNKEQLCQRLYAKNKYFHSAQKRE